MPCLFSQKNHFRKPSCKNIQNINAKAKTIEESLQKDIANLQSDFDSEMQKVQDLETSCEN